MSNYSKKERELKSIEIDNFLNNLPNQDYRTYKSWKNKKEEYNWIKKHITRLKKPSQNGKGWYKKYWCDSTWELVFIIYNLEHNIKFEKEPKGFEYEFKGKRCTYYPDFYLIDNKTYVEIKSILCGKDKCKIKHFNEALIVLKKVDLKKHFEYVIKKYGNNLHSLYENTIIY